jgi:hypothetical protein
MNKIMDGDPSSPEPNNSLTFGGVKATPTKQDLIK